MSTQDTLPAPAAGHSIFSPSAAARWLACPGSLLPNLEAPDTSGVDAAIGTVAHHIGEGWLRYGHVPKAGWLANHEIHGSSGLTVPVDQEMMDYVQQYVDWVRADYEVASVIAVEQKVDFSHLTPIPKQTGTADSVVIWGSPRGGVLILTDFKYGKGVKVYAEQNPQLMIYALGLLEHYDFIFDIKRVILRICQPRLHHFDTWEVSVEDLLAFGEMVKRQAAIALQPNAYRLAGEKQCRFCKVKATCPAVVDALAQMADDSFEDLTATTPARAQQVALDIEDRKALPPRLPDVKAMTTQQMARLIPYRKMVEGWFAAMWTEAEARALRGETVEGYHVVEGRSRRKWAGTDVTVAQELKKWGVAPYDTEIISPAEAEKRLAAAKHPDLPKKKDVQALVAEWTEKPRGKPTLAPLKDERPATDDSDGEVFEDVS